MGGTVRGIRFSRGRNPIPFDRMIEACHSEVSIVPMKPMSSVPLSRREVLCRLPVRLGALLLLTRASRARAQGRVPVPHLQRVVFDDDRFVAVGTGGVVVTS